MIRAKLKPIEQMPDWTRCCDAFYHDLARLIAEEQVYELGIPLVFRSVCGYCGRERTMPHRIDKFGMHVPMDAVDIDERPE